MAKPKNMDDYAMYRGDTFIDLGTLDELADKYGTTRKHMRYLATAAVHRRLSGNKALLLYRIKDDKNDRTN